MSESGHRTLAWPLAAMFATQAISVVVFLTVPVMATEIAPAFGVEAKDIGIFMSVVFAAAMICSAASGSLIQRYGGVRTNQIGMTFSALCLLLALCGSIPLLFLAAVLIGIGYGPNTPSGTHILARVTPPHARGFVFSLKQSGAPLGGLLAGLILPAIVVRFGWQAAIVASVSLSLCAVAAIQPLRATLDDDRDASTPLVFVSPWRAVRTLLANRPLRRLVAVAFSLTTIQAVILSFLIIILVQEVEADFTVAGAIFGGAQAAGAGLRIAMGWIADKTFGTKTTLGVLGIVSALALTSLVTLNPSTPLPVVIGLSIVAGALSFGWNGVFLAEVVNLAPPSEVGSATGGSLLFLYGGIVVGPTLVTLLVSASGGYTLPLCGIAALTLLASLNLLAR